MSEREIALDAEGVERAAEALHGKVRLHGPWKSTPGVVQDLYRKDARAAVAAYLEAQAVTTVEELDALDVDAVIRDREGRVWEKLCAGWVTIGNSRAYDPDCVYLPATVIYRPTP